MCNTKYPFFTVVINAKLELFSVGTLGKDGSHVIAVSYKSLDYAKMVCKKLNVEIDEARMHKEHKALTDDHCN